MARIHIEKLSPAVADNIKNGVYSAEELDQVYRTVRQRHALKERGFLRATIIALVVGITLPIFALMAAVKSPGADTAVILVSSAVTLGIIILLLVGIKILAVDRMINQFLRALEIGYPEKLTQYGRESFRFNNILE